MSLLIHQLLEERKDKPVVKRSRIPREDGLYTLPNGMHMCKEGDIFEVSGKFDKKRAMRLKDTPIENLRILAAYPGVLGWSEEKISALSAKDLIHYICEKPAQKFHLLWILTSGAPEARSMRKLLAKARPHKDY